MSEAAAPSAQAVKSCCAAAYGADWARLLLGDSMHPGGLRLTRRIGRLLELGPATRVLDVAAGRGTSALALAGWFGCRVAGLDLSPTNVRAAREQASRSGLDELASFGVGDAEALPFAGDAFDAVISECAFCTFPDKSRAAREMARVLRPGGRVGLGDLVRRGELPAELDTLAGWVACIADARSEEEYTACLAEVGLQVVRTECHDQDLSALVEQVRARLLTAGVLAAAGRLDLPGVDLPSLARLGRAAASAVRDGRLGYAVLIATSSG